VPGMLAGFIPLLFGLGLMSFLLRAKAFRSIPDLFVVKRPHFRHIYS
jgi:hypothetical protein